MYVHYKNAHEVIKLSYLIFTPFPCLEISLLKPYCFIYQGFSRQLETLVPEVHSNCFFCFFAVAVVVILVYFNASYFKYVILRTPWKFADARAPG